MGDPYLLLDGQQRLTSLAAILRDMPVRTRIRGEIKTTRIGIYFNMDHPESVTSPDTGDDGIGAGSEDAVTDHRIFRLEGRAVAADPRWIPVAELFRDGPVPTLGRTGIGPGDPNYQKYLTRLVDLQRVASYQYPVQILDKSVSYEEVTDIFVRLNSQGTSLRRSDLALAQVTSRWKGAMDLFTEAADKFSRMGFPLDEGFLIRCLISVSTGQCRFKNIGRTYEKTGAGAGRSWEKTSGPAAPQAWVAICLARPRAQAPPPRASNGFAEGHAAALAAAANILLHYASSFFLARLRNLLSLRSYLGVLLCVYGLRLTST